MAKFTVPAYGDNPVTKHQELAQTGGLKSQSSGSLSTQHKRYPSNEEASRQASRPRNPRA